jgi:hypothetical protein
MEEIKAPKKERKFLKAVGEVALTLFRELLLGVGKKVINKVGNKRQGLVIGIVVLASCLAFAQYPNTSNKQRLGYQTTGDGLVYRGRASDTVSLKSTGLNNAYIIIDTLQNVMYNYIKTKGGWQFNNADTVIINNNFSQPVDSLFFNVGVPTNNVDTAKMRWDSDLSTVVLGLNDNVPNELGFKNFWLVKNQTGSTITKGSLVYANGTVGASGRVTIAKFIANGTIDAKYLLGITAHDLSNGEDGYVISFGKIRKVNTDTFAAGAILYPSPTVAGVWTDVEPIAPNLDMPIGFCINSSSNNGTIAIRVASGYSLNELHNVAISSPVEKASLYYRGGLWRDTTAALLVSDTSSMLTNYLRSGVASNTYLPLAGGTLTGALNGTTGTFNTRLGVGSIESPSITSLFTSGTGNQEVHFTHTGNTAGATVTLRLTTNLASLYNQGAYFQGIVNRGVNEFSGAIGTNGSEYIRLRGVDDGGIVGVGIFNNNPSYNLDLTGTFRATGNSLIGGTLGVTGATTLSNLAGSGTRMVTASSTGLLSTQTIPTGTVTSVTGSSPISSSGGTTPNISMTAAGVNVSGYVTHDGTQIFTGNKSFLGQTTMTGIAFFKDYAYQATRLAGLSSTDRFATVTLGTGLSLSGGVLSATSGGVISVTASTPLSSSGGATPNITIANASSSASGVVTTGTQVFAGEKEFEGRIKTTALERVIVNSTGTSISLGTGVTWLNIHQDATVTVTLPSAASYRGREIIIKQTGSGVVLSASSNIIGFTTAFNGATQTAIINPAGSRFATLVSDGTNWIIMQRNN